MFLAATRQLYERYFLSVLLSVCPSVCLSITHFWLCSHHRIIMKFSGFIAKDLINVHAKVQGQRSKVKVTEVTTQLNHCRTVTPVWIHIWWWNDTYSLMYPRRGALLFFKVIRPGLGSIPYFQFNSNSNSFTFNSNSNSNSFGMKNSNSNFNSFLSIPIPIPFYQFFFNSFLKPNLIPPTIYHDYQKYKYQNNAIPLIIFIGKEIKGFIYVWKSIKTDKILQ